MDNIDHLSDAQEHVNVEDAVANEMMTTYRGFGRANVAEADLHLRMLAPTDENYNWRSPFHAHRAGEISEMGVGIHLYFTYLRDLALIIAALILIYLPQFVLTACGNMSRSSSILNMGGTMVSNIGYLDTMPPDLEAQEAAELFIERPVLVYHETSLSIAAVTTACGVLDFIGFVGVLVWLIWFLKVRTPQIVTENDIAHHTMSDHTVMVSRLPKRHAEHLDYKVKLKEHFLKILEKGPSKHYTADRDSLIVEVVLARDHEGHIEEIIELGEAKHELAAMKARESFGGKAKPEKKLKLEKKVEHLFHELVENHKHTSHRDVYCAFVTFKHAHDKDFIELIYGPSVYWFAAQEQPHSLRFEKHSIRVETAPEPDDIIWENLDFPTPKRIRNVCLIWLCVLLVLMVSFLIVAIIKIWAREDPVEPSPLATRWQIFADLESSPRDGGWVICDVNFFSDFDCLERVAMGPAVAFEGSMFNDPNAPLVTPCVDPASIWRTDVSYQGLAAVTWPVGSGEPAEIKCVQITQGVMSDYAAVQSEPTLNTEVRACDPVSPTNATSAMACNIALTDPLKNGQNVFLLAEWNESPPDDCDMVDLTGLTEEDFRTMEEEEYPNSEWYQECYCLDNIVNALRRWDSCEDALWRYIKFELISLLASGIVHIMNSVVKKVIRSLVDYEHPWSSSQKMILSMTKVFVAQYVNTAWIVLLINIQWTNTPIMHHDKQLTGEFAEANAAWYDEVGNEFATVSLLHIFFPHILKLSKLPFAYLKRKFLGPKKLIQEDLNKLYSYKEFKIDCKLAAVGAMVCFAFQYCAGVPIVLCFTFLAVCAIYWCDKVDLLWGSRRPPPYNYKIAYLGVAGLFVGILGHFLFSCGFYGHPIIFPSHDLFGYGKKMVDMITIGFEEEGEAMTYEYETQKGLFTNAMRTRLPAYIFSSASILQFIMFCLMVVFTIVIVILGVLVVTGAPKNKFIDYAMIFFESKANPFTEDEDFHHLKKTLKARGATHSYAMQANKKYRGVWKALNILDDFFHKEGGVEDIREVEHEKEELDKLLANLMSSDEEEMFSPRAAAELLYITQQDPNRMNGRDSSSSSSWSSDSGVRHNYDDEL